MKHYPYVILGGSIAAVAAIEGIRSEDKEGEILVVGEEPCKAYGRPLISYYLLGETDLPRMDYRPEAFYEENHVMLRLGVRAERIDPEEKTVTLSDGEKLGYEKLLVATGSRPFDPPMEGIEHVKELVDLAPRILPAILDETGAKMVQSALEARGAAFFLSDSVLRFEGNTAHLKSGKTVAFDLLVIAVGVRPNTELIKEAGGEVRRGIAVDECGRTSLPDIFAAGDCAESFDIASGTSKVLALLPNAAFQGRAAGVNMAGGKAKLDNAVAFNSIGFFGTHVMTAGTYEGEMYCERTERTYKVLFTKDGLLKGFILINLPERAGIYLKLLQERIPLGAVDFEALKTSPAWSAFSPEARAKNFAREV